MGFGSKPSIWENEINFLKKNIRQRGFLQLDFQNAMRLDKDSR
jgi:hypothetical protein